MQNQNYSSLPETLGHIGVVMEYLADIAEMLVNRGFCHDQSKMEEPEVAYFDEYTPKLAGSTYGSDEYKQLLAELKPALDHHYAVNRHHPEHFENCNRGMNLVDIVEMFCDWYAASKRHDDGDIMKSTAINQKRFGYSDDLKMIFENTCRDIFVEKRDE
jgi:hypothetical protein